jgi:hypothetical protein
MPCEVVLVRVDFFKMAAVAIFKSPFFVSMATAAKFVQQNPIFLAYLVPLAVDVVPIRLHQFLFGEAMVTKVQIMLNSLPTSQSFAVIFPVTSTSS